MNYELAKKLKDGGFKQKGNGFYSIPDNVDAIAKTIKNLSAGEIIPIAKDGVVYLPTLSELIEACGDRFMEVGKYTSRTGKYKDYKWYAHATTVYPFTSSYPKGGGSTPEEAVAFLYISLHSKDA